MRVEHEMSGCGEARSGSVLGPPRFMGGAHSGPRGPFRGPFCTPRGGSHPRRLTSQTAWRPCPAPQAKLRRGHFTGCSATPGRSRTVRAGEPTADATLDPGGACRRVLPGVRPDALPQLAGASVERSGAVGDDDCLRWSRSHEEGGRRASADHEPWRGRGAPGDGAAEDDRTAPGLGPRPARRRLVARPSRQQVPLVRRSPRVVGSRCAAARR